MAADVVCVDLSDDSEPEEEPEVTPPPQLPESEIVNSEDESDSEEVGVNIVPYDEQDYLLNTKLIEEYRQEADA